MHRILVGLILKSFYNCCEGLFPAIRMISPTECDINHGSEQKYCIYYDDTSPNNFNLSSEVTSYRTFVAFIIVGELVGEVTGLSFVG